MEKTDLEILLEKILNDINEFNKRHNDIIINYICFDNEEQNINVYLDKGLRLYTEMLGTFPGYDDIFNYYIDLSDNIRLTEDENIFVEEMGEK